MTGIGTELDERARRLVELRGGDPLDAEAYAEALSEAGYATIATERLGGDVETMIAHDLADHRAGRLVVRGVDVNREAVDVARVVDEELARLGSPLPTEVGRAGSSGVADRARRLLRDKGITSYDEVAFRTAVRQAIADLMNPKRRA